VTIRPGSLTRLNEAIRAGAAPADLGQSLAYAAALRVAHFGNATSTRLGDGASRLHLRQRSHQMLTRIGTANIDTHVTAVRGVLHGAMALYLVAISMCRQRASRATAASSSMICPRIQDDRRRLA